MSAAQAHGDAVLATLADSIVRKQAPRLIADAGALVSVAAWPDFPEGLAVLEPPAGGGPAFSIGSGHVLAASLGCVLRPAAVVVGVSSFLRDGLRSHGLAQPDAVVAGVAVEVEAAALHEAAHAAIAPLDDPADETSVVACRLVAASGSAMRPEPWLAAHGPAWAVAYKVLAERAIAFRPHVAGELRAMIDADLEQHGVDPRGIAAVVDGFPDEAPLRGLPDRERLALAAAAMLPPGDRVAVVEKTLARHRAASGVWCAQRKGSVIHGGGCFGALAAARDEAA